MRLSMKLTTMLVICFAILASVLTAPNSAEASRKRIDIIALGDSYTSGNGALSYYGPRGCYRSRNNYSLQYARKLYRNGYSVGYTNAACSGAVMRDIPNQLAALSRSQKKKADLVFVSIGGNDVGFSPIVVNCFTFGLMHEGKCKEKLFKAFDLVPKIKATYVQRVKEIRAQMPQAKVVLVGYPYLLDACRQNSMYVMPRGFRAGDSVRSLILYAMAMQKNVARQLGSLVQYIDLIDAYRGHEVCGSKKPLYIRGNFDTPIRQEWWHPNVQGHARIAKLLYDSKVHS